MDNNKELTLYSQRNVAVISNVEMRKHNLKIDIWNIEVNIILETFADNK